MNTISVSLPIGVKDASAPTAVYACSIFQKQLKGKGRLCGLCMYVCMCMCICTRVGILILATPR